MVDNEFYNREAENWWSGNDSPLMMIRYMMNPVRFKYVVRNLESLMPDYSNRRVLDVGCGGGFLTEEIAKFGMEATGLDPSAPSLAAARIHAESLGLKIQYIEGVGEKLPFENDEFDMVFCCDVFEHVVNLEKVLDEICRVLRPGGILFFETVNRTLLSFFVVIFLLQEWKITQIIPRNIHCWESFIKPEELVAALSVRNLEVRNIQGIFPGWNFIYYMLSIRRLVKKKIGFEHLCRLFKCHESFYKGLCFIGYAVKNG